MGTEPSSSGPKKSHPRPSANTIGCGSFARKTPPVVRPGLERDYKDQFRIYILPKFETTLIADLTPALLEAFRSYLLQEYVARTPTKRLSLKSVKNIMDASFRA